MRARAASRTSQKREAARARSEEHTSELQSRFDLVCRLLLEKKKKHPRRSRLFAPLSGAAPPLALEREIRRVQSRPSNPSASPPHVSRLYGDFALRNTCQFAY